MPAKEILAELGSRWKKLNEDDKKKVDYYKQLATIDKTRYEEEMKNYVPNDEQEPKEKKKKAAPKKKQRKEPEPVIEEEDEEVEKSNEDIVREIIDNFEGDTVTKKAIKEELKKRGIELSKDEFNEIITKINE
jgi:hypothetical protein